MEHEESPLRATRRLTPELFDYYVARARAERAKAIAEFGGQVAAWLSGLVGRLTQPRHGSGPGDITPASAGLLTRKTCQRTNVAPE